MGSDDLVKHHSDYTNFDTTDASKQSVLFQVVENYRALVDDQRNWVCNLANAASLIWEAYHKLNASGLSKADVNWSGFYVVDKLDTNQLILAPFQGKVACQTIPIGKGVCGKTASTKQTQLVPDVNKFPGHIACDGETNSEIVVPILLDNELKGVLDIDSLTLEGFDEVDADFLQKLADLIAATCDW
ncbi:L-methionine (R)-S-oxide reductase [Ascoidea rubescens DSM 1968]|uniref:GAF domain-like protein n=1 Tax=Ascoidea rubescens DSM 1968 TaxID=1344418 RepID=A0A1D2VA90_9ASCO|nr:GAF domain-like protein [Ascoidea rubescens DSM 1968]ODV58377.1 GAF domain-like protein [Ascoidea rubescens DSM 1968]